MAHFEEFGKSDRKSNIELNLVPFIDLMSVCIIFLLITAVWTQVSMLQIGSSVYSNKTEEQPIVPPPFSKIVLRVDVLPAGFRVVLGNSQTMIPILSDNQYDQEALVNKLKEAKNSYPSKIDGITSVRDNILYKHLVSAMDALLIAGFEQISITTTGVQ